MTTPILSHSEWPQHCATCGVDWPKGANGICPKCRAGLSCRADTTDTVAPDPPCASYRRRQRDNDENGSGRMMQSIYPHAGPGTVAMEDTDQENGSCDDR